MNERRRAIAARTAVITGAGLMIVTLTIFCFYHYLLFFPDVGAFFRLLPILSLCFLLGLEMILIVPLFLYKRKPGKKHAAHQGKKSRLFWITLAILIMVFIAIELSGMGKDTIRVSIITLGVPLLEGQIWFTGGAIGIFLLARFAWSSIPNENSRSAPKYQDVLIFFLIWLIAFSFWMSFPLPEHNYFAPVVRPPTFDKYPFSDAEQYDYNSLYVLFGALDNFVVSKPLYVSFLTILHFIGGFDYGTIVLLQTAVVALFPAIAYLVGKNLHSRLAGSGLAMLLILREANSIQASTMANVSNSKLLMSDVPATLIAAIITLVIIRWCIQKNEKITHHIFLLGGLTAMLNLMRIQTIVLIPFFILLIIIRYFRNWKKILQASGVFLITVALLLSPTLIRNHNLTGAYWLDNPASSHGLYTYFTRDSDASIEIPEADDNTEYLSRNISVIFSVFFQDFSQIFDFFLDNFSRNLISTFLILPARLGNQIPFEEYFRMTSPFFQEVYSIPGILNAGVVVLNLLILAYGFSKIVRDKTIPSAMTILLYFMYNASSSIVRLSGWRFIQPVDWIMLILFVVGLIELFQAILKRMSGQKFVTAYDKPEPPSLRNHRKIVDIFSTATFVFLCAFIPLREGLLPDRYPPYKREVICQEISDFVSHSKFADSRKEINEFCFAESTRVYMGYGFYPRFFKAGEGYYNRPHDQYFGRQDYDRLVFRLIGEKNGKIYIKTGNSDIAFRDGDLVYALVENKPKADAQIVIIAEELPSIIFSDPILDGEQTTSGLQLVR